MTAAVQPRLSIVVPCYNEEQVLPETHNRLTELLDHMIEGGKITDDSEVYFVDDGSSDAATLDYKS